MSQSQSVAKWKIIAGVVTALGVAFLGGGATERFIVREPVMAGGFSEERLRAILRDEIEPLKSRMAALETRTALNESELATYRSMFMPKLERLETKLSAVAESIEFIRGRWEKQ